MQKGLSGGGDSMKQIEIIINILEKSIQKNGDKPLTLSHLKNILGMAANVSEQENSMLYDCVDPNE
jgi:hypothetical protein